MSPEFFKLVGIVKLDRLLAGLLPSAALMGYEAPDLAFAALHAKGKR